MMIFSWEDIPFRFFQSASIASFDGNEVETADNGIVLELLAL
jgi:hypothetical protein